MKKTLLTFVLGFASLSQAAEIHSAQGIIDAPDNPQKVVSYDVGVLDTLDALGVAAVGIPDKSKKFLDYLDVSKAKVVGTLFEPDLEKLNALQPDWIVVASRSASKLNVVSAIAPSADLTVNGNRLFPESLQRLDDLGVVFGQEAKAQAIKSRLLKLRDHVKSKVPANNKSLMLILTGPKIALYGPSSRAGWLDSELGFNLVEDAKYSGKHGEPVSFEYIAETNPDWLLIIDRAAAVGKKNVASAQAVLDNPLVAKTTAWQKGQVIYLDPVSMYISIGGVQGLERVLTQIDNALDN